MSEFYNRDISVNVGGTLITSRSGEEDVSQPTLSISFKIEQALKPEPDPVELKIRNLSDATRAKFQEEKVPVVIEAGYVGNTSRIFAGDLSFGSSTKQGTDWLTTFSAGDGEAKYRASRMNDSIKAGAKFKEVIGKVLDATGFGGGNVLKKIDAGNFRGALEEFSKGTVLSGNASDILAKLAKTLGFEFQVRDGQAEFFKLDETTEDTAIVLDQKHGLLGVPEVGENGVIMARSLLNAGLYPARRTQIIARRTDELGLLFDIDGFFKVRRVVHTGDTRGNDWFSDIEAAPL